MAVDGGIEVVVMVVVVEIDGKRKIIDVSKGRSGGDGCGGN